MADELSRNFLNVNISAQGEHGIVGSRSIEFIDVDEWHSGMSNDVKPVIQADIKPVMPFQMPSPEMPPMPVEQKKKNEEVREVKHRLTGRICVGNLRRRMTLSADNAADFFRNLPQQNTQGARNVSESSYHRGQSSATTSRPSVAASIIVRPVAAGIGAMPFVQPPTQNGSRKTSAQPQSTFQQATSSNQAQQQQQQQQQQIQNLPQMIYNDAFCTICQQQYTNRKGLKKHEKTQKHKLNVQQIEMAQKRLLDSWAQQAQAN